MTIPHQELLRHRGFLERLARDLVADPERASDIAQETWVRALERGPRSSSALRAWMARVAHSLALRGAEREANRRAREREAARPEAHVAPGELDARLALQRRVVDAVQALREPYRSAVFLRYYDGLAPAEIALRLGVPTGTVKTRLKRGLALLRADLERDAGEPLRALAAAPLLAPSQAGAAAAPLGGLLVGTKLLGGAAAAALLAGIVFLLRGGLAAPERPGTAPAAGPASAARPEAGRVPAELEGVAPAGPAEERVHAEVPQASGARPAAEPAARADARAAGAPQEPERLLLRGRVYHRSGPPAPFALVMLQQARARADASGAFELDLEQARSERLGGAIDRDAALVAVLAGYAPCVVPGFGASAEQSARAGEPLELVLPGEAGAISGVVLEASGAPAVGWRIKLLDGTIVAKGDYFPLSAEDVAAEPDAAFLLDAGSLAAAPGAVPRKGYRETDAEGRFALGGLALDRTYRLRAWNERTLQSVESEPLLAGTQGYVLQVPDVPARPFVDGVVVGTDGLPLSDVRCRLTMVEHSAGGGSWMTTGQEVHTGPDGRFAFHDVPHDELFVRFNGHGSGTHLDLEPLREYRDVRVVLERAGAFRFEARDPATAPDRVAVENAAGERLRMQVQLEPGVTTGLGELPVAGGVSPEALVHESARTLVLLREGREIGRLDLAVRAGDVVIVRR